MQEIRKKTFYRQLKTSVESGIGLAGQEIITTDEKIAKIYYDIGGEIYNVVENNDVSLKVICDLLAEDVIQRTSRHIRRYVDFYTNWKSFSEFLKYCKKNNIKANISNGIGLEQEKKVDKKTGETKVVKKLPSLTEQQMKVLFNELSVNLGFEQDKKIETFKKAIIKAMKDEQLIQNIRKIV